MKKTDANSLAKAAMVTLAEMKASMKAFDREESNVFDALDSVAVAIEAYQAAAQSFDHKSRQSCRGKAAYWSAEESARTDHEVCLC
jgi:hypothetical protein